jgi:hypothetical protein
MKYINAIEDWLASLMIGWLQRHGYVVLRQPFCGLVVGGGAMAMYDADTNRWDISFPWSREHLSIYALNGSLITNRPKFATTPEGESHP